MRGATGYGKGQRPLPNRTDSYCKCSCSVVLAAFAGNGTVANVGAVEAAFPVDFCRQFVRLLLRGIDGPASGVFTVTPPLALLAALDQLLACQESAA